jgi:dTDP-4-amino-4,6-dideoxygalactose transaminase
VNGKNSELHAAMGLSNLRYFSEILEARRKVSEVYDSILSPEFYRPPKIKGEEYNYAYYPILCRSEEVLLEVVEKLNTVEVFPRRYFFPSLNQITYVSGAPCPVSEDTAGRILCLPLYHDLPKVDVERIGRILNQALKG